MEWKWAENSILNQCTENIPCRAIFQAVTDEIARYYQDKGFRYSASRPKIVHKDSQIKLEICFWSSSSNIPGSHVCLEVLPSFYSQELKNIGNKGFILGHTDIFYKYNQNGVSEKVCEYRFDIHAINVEEFKKIIAAIDSEVLPWIEKLKTADGINEMKQKRDCGSKGNSVFEEYVRLHSALL